MKTINHHRRGFLGCTFKAEKQNVKVKEVYLNASFFKQEDTIYSIQNEPIESMYQLEAIIKSTMRGIRWILLWLETKSTSHIIASYTNILVNLQVFLTLNMIHLYTKICL